MNTAVLKDLEYLPSQLRFDVDTKIDIENLLPKLIVLFPVAQELKIENSTLYAIAPTEAITFIQMAENKVIILFLPDSQLQTEPKPVWNAIEQLLVEIGATELKNCTWQAQVAHRFTTKKERDTVARRLSPLPEYQASSITLHPEEQANYHVQVAMAKRSKTEQGLIINVIFQTATISADDVPSMVAKFEQELYGQNTFQEIVSEILAALASP